MTKKEHLLPLFFMPEKIELLGPLLIGVPPW
jgi:hypothetical protein